MRVFGFQMGGAQALSACRLWHLRAGALLVWCIANLALSGECASHPLDGKEVEYVQRKLGEALSAKATIGGAVIVQQLVSPLSAKIDNSPSVQDLVVNVIQSYVPLPGAYFRPSSTSIIAAYRTLVENAEGCAGPISPQDYILLERAARVIFDMPKGERFIMNHSYRPSQKYQIYRSLRRELAIATDELRAASESVPSASWQIKRIQARFAELSALLAKNDLGQEVETSLDRYRRISSAIQKAYWVEAEQWLNLYDPRRTIWGRSLTTVLPQYFAGAFVITVPVSEAEGARIAVLSYMQLERPWLRTKILEDRCWAWKSDYRGNRIFAPGIDASAFLQEETELGGMLPAIARGIVKLDRLVDTDGNQTDVSEFIWVVVSTLPRQPR